MLLLLAAAVTFVAADEDEHPARLLGVAAKRLAQMPVAVQFTTALLPFCSIHK